MFTSTQMRVVLYSWILTISIVWSCCVLLQLLFLFISLSLSLSLSFTDKINGSSYKFGILLDKNVIVQSQLLIIEVQWASSSCLISPMKSHSKL